MPVYYLLKNNQAVKSSVALKSLDDKSWEIRCDGQEMAAIK